LSTANTLLLAPQPGQAKTSKPKLRFNNPAQSNRAPRCSPCTCSAPAGASADAGGSNGYRPRAWKLELQRFADETGLHVCVCHFPPGTSKWNKMEHRLFCHITQNWRGRPLVSYATIVNLIGSTQNATGLRVRVRLDRKDYPTGGKISNAEIKQLALKKSTFHGEWNYELLPRKLAK
jgi:hypothetical protein